MDWKTAAVELARRLAGRLDDATLRTVRSFLGAGEQQMMTGTLVGALAREQVPLDDAEYDLLEDMDARLVGGLSLDEDAARLRYEFLPRTTDPVRPDAPGHVLAWARANRDARALYLTWRQPTAAARCPEGWVYVLVIASGRDVAGMQAGVQAAVQNTPGAVGVEVVAEGEDLPPYQAAALASAVPVEWDRG